MLLLDDLPVTFPTGWFAIDARGTVTIARPSGDAIVQPLDDAEGAVARLAAAKPINRTQVSRLIRARMKLGKIAMLVMKHPDGHYDLARNFATDRFPLFDRVDLADIAAERFGDVAPDVAALVLATIERLEAMAQRAFAPVERAEVIRLLGRASDRIDLDADLFVKRLTRTFPELGAAMRANIV